MTKLAPGFLVAMPQQSEFGVSNALVLLIEHGADGSMGLLVNRPLSVPDLRDVSMTHGFELRDDLDDFRIFKGGFAETERGFLLHDGADIAESVAVLPGLFLSGSIESLRAVLETTAAVRFRLCLGYLHWPPGQLERELCEGVWLTADPDPAHIFETPPEQAWGAVLRDMGIEPGRLMQSSGVQ